MTSAADKITSHPKTRRLWLGKSGILANVHITGDERNGARYRMIGI